MNIKKFWLSALSVIMTFVYIFSSESQAANLNDDEKNKVNSSLTGEALCDLLESEGCIVYNDVEECEDGSFLFSYTSLRDNICFSSKAMIVPGNTSDSVTIRKIIDDNNDGAKGLNDSNVITRSMWDSTSSFMLKLVCTAEVTSVISGVDYWKLTSVHGEVIGASGTTGSNLGSGVTLVSETMTAHSIGLKADGNRTTNQVLTAHPTSRSWTYNMPSYWVPTKVFMYTDIGATLEVVARRGTSGNTWSTLLNCPVFSN